MEDRLDTQQAIAGRRPMSRARFWLRLTGFAFLGAAFLFLFYGAIAYFAWQQGESMRLAGLAEQRQNTITRQIELARADIEAGNYQLALRRLDYVAANDPDNPGLPALRQSAEDGRLLLLVPPVTPTPTPTRRPQQSAPPAVTPTPDPEAEKAIEEAFNELQTLVRLKRWTRAVEEITDFRARYPNYRRREVDEMLYEAYVNHGLSLTRGAAIERGLFYLKQAARLGDLSEQVLGEIFWAEQYLEGIVYFGVDWETYLSYFRPMCQYAPLYQNSCGRLATGLVRYADARAAVLDWCPAEALYREALATNEVKDRSAVREQLNTAAEWCLQATPTPEPTLEGEGGAEATPDPAEPEPQTTPEP